jgi:cephalosporin-C deacetylase
MPNVDMPLSQMYNYRPELTAKPDFDDFWQHEKERSANKPLNAKLTQVDYPVRSIQVFELVYEGIDGTPVHGWYVLPSEAFATKPMPVMVRYHGYSGDRGKPQDLLQWAAMGIASVSVDTRGQGGHTPDLSVYPKGGISGWMTLGIEDPQSYYFKYAYMDCVRALDFVAEREELDSSRIAVYGGSQGGGLTLAVAGIDDRPKLALPVYPFLCDYRRSVEIHSSGPYAEIKNWFRKYDPEHSKEEQIYGTLSYFDGMNFASRIKARTLMAISLQDVTCPPSTCFAAYNHLNAEKEAAIYHDYGHEGLPFHDESMMRFVERYL